MFSKDNDVRYYVRSPFFEHALCVKKGERLPTKSPSRGSTGDADEWHSIDAYWWLREQAEPEQPGEVYEQTLRQDDGYKLTQLAYEK